MRIFILCFIIISAVQPINGILANETDKQIRIAAIIAETGRYATNGKAMRTGYQLAIDHINTQGGIKIAGHAHKLVLTLHDDNSSPLMATDVLERLIQNQSIRYFLGPYGAGIARALAPVVERFGVLMIGAPGAMRASRIKQPRRMFNLRADPSQTMTEILRAVQKVGKNQNSELRIATKGETWRLAILTSDDWVAQKMRSNTMNFIKKTGMILGLDSTLSYGTVDLADQMQAITALKPHILLLIAQSETLQTLLKNIPALPKPYPLIGALNCDAEAFTKRKKPLPFVLVCPISWHSELLWLDPIFGSPADFSQLYQQKFRQQASSSAAMAAASVTVLAEALRRANSTETKAVHKHLTEKRFDTIIGPVEFDHTGHNKNLRVPIIQYIGTNPPILIAPSEAAPNDLRVNIP